MQPLDDSTLLHKYAKNQSDEAFAALVTGHINLVYSVAFRATNNPHHAEEITQAVFIILAQKAGQLRHDRALSSWLFQTTRLTANNFLRSEIRRQRREQEACMETISNESAEAVWPRIAERLDPAVEALGEKDRRAIVLRFYENNSLRDVGLALNISEAAAEKRVNRAVEKLRKFFTKRGVALPAALLTAAIAGNSVQAAPIGLAKIVTTTAVAKGAAASTSTLTLVKGALKMMTWMKMKTAVAIGVGVLLAAGGITASSMLLTPTEAPVSFEAEGTITYTPNFGPGESYSDTKHFIVSRIGNLWKIRTINVKEERTGMGGPPSESLDLYYEMGFDGTNLYTLEQQDEKKVLPKFSPDVIQSGRYDLAEGRVEKAEMPPCMDTRMHCPVWLAYCAAPYLANHAGNKIVSPDFGIGDFLTEHFIPKIALPAKWKAKGSSFVEEISWYSDGTYPNTIARGRGGRQLTFEKFPSPYDKDFLSGRLKNETWTNFEGMTIPASFTLTSYRPTYEDAPGAKPHFTVGYTITGSIESVRKISTFSPIPELSPKTGVTDWRSPRGGQPISYSSTNWQVPASFRATNKR